ncbi:hypothetical protein MMC18_009119 [Xylographa bjoerkii]|nr:hypothetical protein [Xylographa bjoerkii]
MASADEQLKRLTDPSLLDKIDGLRKLNVSEYIPLHQACDAMGIPAPGQSLAPGLSTFSDDILTIELSGPSRQLLSIIDVPGIFRTPTYGVTTKEDMTLVQRMVKSYIKDSRTIILGVIPAPVDIATQEILSMAEEADPLGQRTLGVLTKPDPVDRGGEDHVIDLVLGTKNKLNLGYCMVRNRGQQDKSLSMTDRHEKEKQFFNTAPWSTLDRERVGVPALQDRLRELLVDITRREFPNVKHELDKRILDCEQKLKSLGPARETDNQQRTLILDLAAKFQEITSHALDAYYDDVWLKGHTIHFSKSTTRNGNEPATESPDGADQAVTVDTSHSTSETGEPEDPKFPELLNVIQGPWRCPAPQSDNIFDWIESAYRTSRVFELGTFDPSLLPIIFQEQSKKWDGLALAYISNVICAVHSFTDDLLSTLCPDRRVQSNLWTTLIDELLERYEKAMSHTRFILHMERKGIPLTTNHYFNDGLQKARLERLKSALKGQAVAIQFGNEHRDMVKVDSVVSSVQTGNIEHTVKDIHAILKSYYKVARKGFVDVVCMQAADHFLVTGCESPLRLFTPSFVHRLSLNSLILIAGEDVVSKRTRNVLEHEIKCLKAGKKLLKG